MKTLHMSFSRIKKHFEIRVWSLNVIILLEATFKCTVKSRTLEKIGSLGHHSFESDGNSGVKNPMFSVINLAIDRLSL